ncbi:MAG: hypothetical protein Kow00127_19900 [Bacteroidales bacterium]
MRAFLPEVYNIPEEQIIGSTMKTSWVESPEPSIVRLPEIGYIDDKEGKPLRIWEIIGKKPVFCGGNSDGDLAMMQWISHNPDGSMMLYIHHTDSVREWAYDRQSAVGKLDKGLDEAVEKDWLVANIDKEWKKVFPDK